MPINITMPALSPTMEEGNLAKWLVKEGDKVKSGDVIAEIETDKATMEVEAVDEGTVAKIVVPAGTEGVKVNALIAILAAEGEDAGAAAKSGGAAAAKAEAPKRGASLAACGADASEADGGSCRRGRAREARQWQGCRRRRPLHRPRRDRPVARLRLAARPAHRQGCRRRHRRRSSGTGPHGRVVKADVEAAVAGGGAKAAPAAKPAPAPAPAAAAPRPSSRCPTRRC